MIRKRVGTEDDPDMLEDSNVKASVKYDEVLVSADDKCRISEAFIFYS